MSRWTEAKLETLSNIESEYFYGALDKLGYKADFSKKTPSRSYEGDSKNVDCVITTKAGVPITVGLRFKEGEDDTVNMEIVTDWYYSKVNENKFTERFTIEYNTLKYTAVAAGMDFSVETVEDMADGRRKIVMRRAA